MQRERVLLVASRYPNHPRPLWNLPGGRQHSGELLEETVAREVFEEAGLRVRVKELAYLTESYDGAVHFVNATFRLVMARAAVDEVRPEANHDTYSAAERRKDHVVEVAWVPIEELSRRIVVSVVRKPLLAYLRDRLPQRYAGFHEAGVTIEWPADSE